MAWDLFSKASVMDILMSPQPPVKASTQFAIGDGIEFITAPTAGAGLAQRVAAATDYMYGILFDVEPDVTKLRAATDQLSTTAGENGVILKVAGTNLITECDITPLINGVACASQTSKTGIKFADAGANATSALIGSTIYVPELDAHAIILTNTNAGNVQTCTVQVISENGRVGGAFAMAPSNVTNASTGELACTVRLLPYATGTNKVKLDATNPHLRVSNAVGDVGGGHIEIFGVDLRRLKVQCIHPAIPAV